jgi:hypothetical protein
MKNLEFAEIETQLNTVVIATKKVNTYTSVQLTINFSIKHGVESYVVTRKNKIVYANRSLGGAIEKYNSFQDIK